MHVIKKTKLQKINQCFDIYWDQNKNLTKDFVVNSSLAGSYSLSLQFVTIKFLKRKYIYIYIYIYKTSCIRECIKNIYTVI